MVNKKSNRFIAAMMALICLVTTAWFSCNKSDGSLRGCEGVVCANGGLCNIDTLTKKAKCYCPTGYEGTNCATASVGKYIGTWKMRQIITGSDSTIKNNDTSYYQVYVKKSATPTTFFIDNFANNPYYNEIVCTISNVKSSDFGIDTLSAYHMLFDNFQITYGYGYITPNDSAVIGTFATRHLTPTSNWVTDTVQFVLTHP